MPDPTLTANLRETYFRHRLRNQPETLKSALLRLDTQELKDLGNLITHAKGPAPFLYATLLEEVGPTYEEVEASIIENL